MVDTFLFNVMTYAALALLALSVLVGLLALLLGLVGDQRMTLRTWLGISWLLSIMAPALTEGALLLAMQVGRSVAPHWFSVNQMQVGVALLAGPLLAFTLTMLALAWLTGRMALRPLTEMRVAARQIAEGDLDIRLAQAPLREVAEVAEAFAAMGQALQHSIRREAQLEQERRLFVSAIAHDLRTPLFALRGYLEGLSSGVAHTPERSARYLAICAEQADLLEGLVADLFLYARLDYLEQQPEREALELGELARRAVATMRPAAEARGITLWVEGECAPCELIGDGTLLLRALHNVLDNAVKYTPEGGQVWVKWWRELGRYALRIADSGPGFPAGDLERVFSPLYRGDASRNRQSGGAGLGLAIARRILVAHHGELTATNGPVERMSEAKGAVVCAYLAGDARDALL